MVIYGRDVWLRVIGTSSHQRCLCVCSQFVVASAWAQAHHAGRHLGETTELGRNCAVEAVLIQILGWGGERTKHESVQWHLLIMGTDNERECTALRRAS